MTVRGITKIRNEAHIIKDTLDNWQQYCPGGIHVYDDCSTDDTVEICRAHPAVVEVVTSTLFDPDRLRAEWYNRQIVLASAQRFLGPDDWVVYFDADEWLFDFPLQVLTNPNLKMAACRNFDMHITPEDEHLGADFKGRKWCDPGWEHQPYFYRNSPYLRFFMPDQRTLMTGPTLEANRCCVGVAQHWGKAISEENWEKKCQYYTEVFGKYQEKWEARKGKAVKRDMLSDFGKPLVRFEDARFNRVPTFCRNQKIGTV